MTREPHTRLSKVQTRKQFMEQLEEMISIPKYDDAQGPGRPPDLKSYIVETDQSISQRFTIEGITYSVIDTGLDDIKIVKTQMHNGTSKQDEFAEFYMDKSDTRFLVLYTNNTRDDTKRVIDTLTKSINHTFDNAWFPSTLLKRIPEATHGEFRGFGMSYSDALLRRDEYDGEDLSLYANGALANDVLNAINQCESIKKTMAYNKVRVRRGQPHGNSNTAQNDVHYDGYIALKYGKSVHDHVQVVNASRDMYRKFVTRIEKERIRFIKEGNTMHFKGQAIEFDIPNKIKDLEALISKMFNCAKPFRLWGLKSQICDGYFKVIAVDLHTGTPLDFEIADDMVRVYLADGNCGNTILRLVTNMQIHFDANVMCDELL